MAKAKKESSEGIFVPAGLLIGIGAGFIYDNVPAGTLIGLGIGFLAMAVVRLVRAK